SGDFNLVLTAPLHGKDFHPVTLSGAIARQDSTIEGKGSMVIKAWDVSGQWFGLLPATKPAILSVTTSWQELPAVIADLQKYRILDIPLTLASGQAEVSSKFRWPAETD